MKKFITPLPNRALIQMEGSDCHSFLQGLVSNDMKKLSLSTPIYAALLTPQGNFLFDFFIVQRCQPSQQPTVVWLDCAAQNLDQLVARLLTYKLRASVEITPVSGSVVAVWGDSGAGAQSSAVKESFAPTLHDVASSLPAPRGSVFMDSRTPCLGLRILLNKQATPKTLQDLQEVCGASAAPLENYQYQRMRLGVLDGAYDMEQGKSFPLHYGMDMFHGIDFEKGCYVGQEVTSRMHRLGSHKRGLFTLNLRGTGPLPGRGTSVQAGSLPVGVLAHASSMESHAPVALASLRYDRLKKAHGALALGDTWQATHWQEVKVS